MIRLFLVLFILLLHLAPKSSYTQSKPELTALFSKHRPGYKFYRIPSIYTTVKGTIIAVCEGRASRSDQAHNDLVMRRSLDNGKTWDDEQTIVDYGYSSVNNPLLVQDQRNAVIYLFYQVYSINVKEKITGDLFGNLDCRAYYITSDDEGETWSNPVDITPVTRAENDFMSLASGPGIGIQIQKGDFAGRLVVPFNQGPWGKWKVFCLYSDDGITWKKSALVPDNAYGMGNEAQVVELKDGTLMLNARSAQGQQMRKTAFSINGGQTWSTFREEAELIESGCMASILRYRGNDEEFLLFSNPADISNRRNGTIRKSEDDGIHWKYSRTIENGFFAYSCLTQLPNGDIGLLYEAKKHKRIVFTSFDPDSLRP